MIFQNFGFNRQLIKAAGAPAAGIFPDQSTKVWTSTETDQWLTAASNVFTIGNGVTYSSYSTVSTALTGNTIAGVLARNGKIYIAGDSGTSTINIWNTNNNTNSTLSLSGNTQAYSMVYNDYTKCVYIPGNGIIYVVDTLTDTQVTTISNPLGNSYFQLYSSGYDAQYIYGTGWFQNNTWFRVDCSNNTAASLSIGTGGDTLNGVMGRNGKIYVGGGGGSTNGYHVLNTSVPQNEYVSGMGNISDSYRAAANHYNGYLYTMPAYGASKIYLMDTSNNSATEARGAVTDNRIGTTILGADGQIYGFGNSANASNNANVYDPVNDVLNYITVPQRDFNWSVIDANGHIYFGQGGNLYKLTASNVPSATLTALAEMNGIIARMR